ATFLRLPALDPPRRTRRGLLRRRRPRPLPRARAAAPGPALGGARRPRHAHRRRVGSAFRPLRAAAGLVPGAARAALPRPPVPLVQSRPGRRARLPVRPVARCPRRPAARPRHQGQRQDALVARRGWALDAQRRRARGAGDRHAGGARRRNVQVVQPGRDGRGADARRRTLAHALGRAGAAQPLPHPHRLFPAFRFPQGRGAAPPVAGPHHTDLPARGMARGRTGARRRLPGGGVPARGAHGRAVDRRRLRPRRAEHGQHQRHGRELRLRPVALPPDLRPGLHRRLLRPRRPLRFRPPAGSVGVEPGAPRRMPAAPGRAARAGSGYGRLRARAAPGVRRRRAAPPGLGVARRSAGCGAGPRALRVPARVPGALRAGLLRLARRGGERGAGDARPGRRTLRLARLRARARGDGGLRAGAGRPAGPPLFRAPRALHDADRRGGGDLGAHRRGRRLVRLPRQAGSDSRDGRGLRHDARAAL
ncbi:MAG: Selenoprotein O and cysteine-containing homologs, partial [uncultured Acetobacteraceae bacterium]